MSKTWITSDQHFGHRNIIKYSGRPYADADEMNAALVTNHNALVKPDDIVVIAGDFALDERLVKLYLSQLNGIKYLVAGNHDTCHPANKRYRERNLQRYVDYGFAALPVISMVLNDEQSMGMGSVLITHMPVAGDHGHVDRYVEHRPTVAESSDVRWVLHGHVHEAWKKRGRMVNVGVDAWNYRPVSLEQIATYLRTAPENEPTPQSR